MNKLAGILFFTSIPGLAMVLLSIILDLSQGNPITMNSLLLYLGIGVTIGVVLVILRFLIKGELWRPKA